MLPFCTVFLIHKPSGPQKHSHHLNWLLRPPSHRNMNRYVDGNPDQAPAAPRAVRPHFLILGAQQAQLPRGAKPWWDGDQCKMLGLFFGKAKLWAVQTSAAGWGGVQQHLEELGPLGLVPAKGWDWLEGSWGLGVVEQGRSSCSLDPPPGGFGPGADSSFTQPLSVGGERQAEVMAGRGTCHTMIQGLSVPSLKKTCACSAWEPGDWVGDTCEKPVVYLSLWLMSLFHQRETSSRW